MDNLSHNGLIIPKKDFCFSLFNRGIKYGDSFFDTVRCSNGFPNFWEEHYYRIASSLLLTKMKTPKNFGKQFHLTLTRVYVLQKYLFRDQHLA